MILSNFHFKSSAKNGGSNWVVIQGAIFNKDFVVKGKYCVHLIKGPTPYKPSASNKYLPYHLRKLKCTRGIPETLLFDLGGMNKRLQQRPIEVPKYF